MLLCDANCDFDNDPSSGECGSICHKHRQAEAHVSFHGTQYLVKWVGLSLSMCTLETSAYYLSKLRIPNDMVLTCDETYGAHLLPIFPWQVDKSCVNAYKILIDELKQSQEAYHRITKNPKPPLKQFLKLPNSKKVKSSTPPCVTQNVTFHSTQSAINKPNIVNTGAHLDLIDLTPTWSTTDPITNNISPSPKRTASSASQHSMSAIKPNLVTEPHSVSLLNQLTPTKPSTRTSYSPPTSLSEPQSVSLLNQQFIPTKPNTSPSTTTPRPTFSPPTSLRPKPCGTPLSQHSLSAIKPKFVTDLHAVSPCTLNQFTPIKPKAPQLDQTRPIARLGLPSPLPPSWCPESLRVE